MSKKSFITDFDGFNALFAQFAKVQNNVCWIRSLDFERQLYLSPQFETVWEQSCETLLNTPRAWNDFLLPLDAQSLHPVFCDRAAMPDTIDGRNSVFYRIKTPSGDVKYIRDWTVCLGDRAGNPVAVGGIAQMITPEIWYDALNSTQSKVLFAQLPGNTDLLDILEKEKKLIELSPSNSRSTDQSNGDNNPTHIARPKVNMTQNIFIEKKNIKLSPREAQVLYHCRLGRTAKETARILCISHRTVETHIGTIQEKTGCRSKLELIGLVSEA